MTMDNEKARWIRDSSQPHRWNEPITTTRDCLTGDELLYLSLRRMGYNKYADAMVRAKTFSPERLLWLNHYLGRVSDSEYYRERARMAEQHRLNDIARAEKEQRMMEVRAQQSGTKEYHQAHNTLKLNQYRKR